VGQATEEEEEGSLSLDGGVGPKEGGDDDVASRLL